MEYLSASSTNTGNLPQHCEPPPPHSPPLTKMLLMIDKLKEFGLS
ncbi:hypothetical protein HanIR_Chr05g0245911 [Helianthus annuus]|nr:hypothetical protein HanIR_Chr05g0245911 [Helianthus annuus]